MPHPNRYCRLLEAKIRTRNKRRLADGDQDLAARPELPAIAPQESESLADVVVLGLNRELHVGREINQPVHRVDVDIHIPAGEPDELPVIADIHFEIFAWPESEIGRY